MQEVVSEMVIGVCMEDCSVRIRGSGREDGEKYNQEMFRNFHWKDLIIDWM